MTSEHTPELRVLKKAVTAGLKECDTIIENSFEQNPDPQQNNEFHIRKHTRTVIDRMVSDIELSEEVAPGAIPPRHIILASLIGGSHDLKIARDFVTKQEGEFVKRTVRRDVGNNERRSTISAVGIMLGLNSQAEEDIF